MFFKGFSALFSSYLTTIIQYDLDRISTLTQYTRNPEFLAMRQHSSDATSFGMSQVMIHLVVSSQINDKSCFDTQDTILFKVQNKFNQAST